MKTKKNGGERRTTILIRRSLHKKLKIESTRKEITIFDLLDHIVTCYFDGEKTGVKSE